MCVEVKIDIENLAKKSAKRELEEETGVFLKEEDLKLFHISHAGSSVKWDLYYYLASISGLDNNEKEIKTEEGEDIKTGWYKRDEVIKMCLAGDIKEDRTLGILLKFLLSQK